ncbi:hypothetical protein V6N13_061098 [Hibiscus sabdariffa]
MKPLLESFFGVSNKLLAAASDCVSEILAATSASTSLVNSSPATRAAPMSIVKTVQQYQQKRRCHSQTCRR